jgi:hypothetical protein
LIGVDLRMKLDADSNNDGDNLMLWFEFELTADGKLLVSIIAMWKSVFKHVKTFVRIFCSIWLKRCKWFDQDESLQYGGDAHKQVNGCNCSETNQIIRKKKPSKIISFTM